MCDFLGVGKGGCDFAANFFNRRKFGKAEGDGEQEVGVIDSADEGLSWTGWLDIG